MVCLFSQNYTLYTKSALYISKVHQYTKSAITDRQCINILKNERRKNINILLACQKYTSRSKFRGCPLIISAKKSVISPPHHPPLSANVIKLKTSAPPPSESIRKPETTTTKTNHSPSDNQKSGRTRSILDHFLEIYIHITCCLSDKFDNIFLLTNSVSKRQQIENYHPT